MEDAPLPWTESTVPSQTPSCRRSARRVGDFLRNRLTSCVPRYAGFAVPRFVRRPLRMNGYADACFGAALLSCGVLALAWFLRGAFFQLG